MKNEQEDWLVASLRISRPYLESLPPEQKEAIRKDAEYQKVIRELERGLYDYVEYL